MASRRRYQAGYQRAWARRAVLGGLTILLLVTLGPFLLVAMNAMKTPSDYATHGPIAIPRALTLAGIADFWQRIDFTRKLMNSLIVSGAVAVLGVGLSVLNAYAIGIGRLRGRTW